MANRPKESAAHTVLYDFAQNCIKEQLPEQSLDNPQIVEQAFIEYHTSMKEQLHELKMICDDIFGFVERQPDAAALIGALREGKTITEAIDSVEQLQSTQIDIDGVAEFFGDNELSDEESEMLVGQVVAMLEKLSSKKIDRELMDSMLKLNRYDRDTEESFRRGVIEGRNQKITEHLMQSTNIDGLCGSSYTNPSQQPKSGYIERLMGGRK